MLSMPPKSSSKKRKAEGEHDADALVAAGFDNAAFVKLAGGGIGLLTGLTALKRLSAGMRVDTLAGALAATCAI